MLRVLTIMLILYALHLQAMESKIVWRALKDLEKCKRIDILGEIYQAINSESLQIKPNICLRLWCETPSTVDKALSEINAMHLCDNTGIISKDTAQIIKSHLNDITNKNRYPLWYSLLHPVPWTIVKER